MAGGLGPAKENQAVAGLCADLQAPQLLGARLGQPREYGAGRIRLDELLGSPQAFRRQVCLNPDELPLAQAHLLQAWQMWMPGWADDDNLPASFDHGA